MIVTTRKEGKNEILGEMERIYGRRKYVRRIREFEECDKEGRRV